MVSQKKKPLRGGASVSWRHLIELDAYLWQAAGRYWTEIVLASVGGVWVRPLGTLAGPQTQMTSLFELRPGETSRIAPLILAFDS